MFIDQAVSAFLADFFNGKWSWEMMLGASIVLPKATCHAHQAWHGEAARSKEAALASANKALATFDPQFEPA